MKEVRWSCKDRRLDAWGILDAYYREDDEKDQGLVPVARGVRRGAHQRLRLATAGLHRGRAGRLRVQTDEEARFCMGCYSAIGVTVDQTFTLARKVLAPRVRYQDLQDPGHAAGGHARARSSPTLSAFAGRRVPGQP